MTAEISKVRVRRTRPRRGRGVSVRNLRLAARHRGVWNAMLNRCGSPNNPAYARYGGRGIKVCERWQNGENGKSGLECFLQDMGPRPSRNYSLDRINNDLGYEPSNCRWTTRSIQQRNRGPHRGSLP